MFQICYCIMLRRESGGNKKSAVEMTCERSMVGVTRIGRIRNENVQFRRDVRREQYVKVDIWVLRCFESTKVLNPVRRVPRNSVRC